jgi:tRNA(Ile)-lysidine synthase
MKLSVNSLLDYIQSNQLIKKEEKILLAVSGGLDSCVMLDLFSKTDLNFGIAHCNFQLRGKDSDEDENFVKDRAKEYDKQFHSVKFHTLQFASENKYSIQEAARILRYKWFDEISNQFNYSKTATAHHLDDSIETFFINMLRKAGPGGLKGIPLINGNIIRPLLSYTRKEIEVYGAENNISYREDASNLSDDYLRNKLRHHVIPSLKESGDFENSMKHLMEDFSFIDQVLKNYLHDWIKKNVSHDGRQMIFPIDKIKEEVYPVPFLSALLHICGLKNIDAQKVLAVKTPGKIFEEGGKILLRNRNELILNTDCNAEIVPAQINSLPATLYYSDLNIVLTLSDCEKKIENVDKNFHQVDAGEIKLPLTIRAWKAGDSFIPLGMKGKKKISDFFVDNKINRFEKDNTYLLLSGNDIVCILGHRIDERYKITSDTQQILNIIVSRK